MNKPYSSILLIFSVLIIYLLFISYSVFELTIMGHSLKKNQLKEYFSELIIDKDVKIQKPSKTIKKGGNSPKISLNIDSSSQRILLIGDSMLEGLGPRLNDYCEENNHTLAQVIWYSSNTMWYGTSDTIPKFIKKFKPTYIILVIGSGDVIADNVLIKRKPYVEKILEQIKGYKYIWVGPPNWRKDSGINELLENSVEEGTFFLSKNLTFERVEDGIHPTRESAAKWMDAITSFIMKESKYPILLKFPRKKASKRSQLYMLSPKPSPK
jgi:hypothetical protein